MSGQPPPGYWRMSFSSVTGLDVSRRHVPKGGAKLVPMIGDEFQFASVPAAGRSALVQRAHETIPVHPASLHSVQDTTQPCIENREKQTTADILCKQYDEAPL